MHLFEGMIKVNYAKIMTIPAVRGKIRDGLVLKLHSLYIYNLTIMFKEMGYD